MADLLYKASKGEEIFATYAMLRITTRPKKRISF